MGDSHTRLFSAAKPITADDEEFPWPDLTEQELYQVYLNREVDIPAYAPVESPQSAALRPRLLKYFEHKRQDNCFDKSTHHLAVTLLDCFMQETIATKQAYNRDLVAACCLMLAGII